MVVHRKQWASWGRGPAGCVAVYWGILGCAGRYWVVMGWMGMQWGPWGRGPPWENTGVQGCSLGFHWGALGCAGVSWPWEGSVWGQQNQVPTSALFTRPTLSPPCRETMRPHWSLWCPQYQQGVGGPNCPPVPQTGCPPSPPHYLHPGYIFHLLLRVPREEEQRGGLDWTLVGLRVGHRCPQSPQAHGLPLV